MPRGRRFHGNRPWGGRHGRDRYCSVSLLTPVMPDLYRADRRMPPRDPYRTPPRPTAPRRSPCGRPGFDGACARRRPVSRGGRKDHGPPEASPLATRQAWCTSKLTKYPVGGGEQSVINWFINRQDSGSTAFTPMLMAESLALNLLFRAVRPRASRHRAKRWTHRSHALL